MASAVDPSVMTNRSRAASQSRDISIPFTKPEFNRIFILTNYQTFSTKPKPTLLRLSNSTQPPLYSSNRVNSQVRKDGLPPPQRSKHSTTQKIRGCRFQFKRH